MRKLVSGLTALMFVFAPFAFAVEDDIDKLVPLKPGLYCLYLNQAEEITAVAIPEKDFVIEKCKEIPGKVMKREADGTVTKYA